MFSLNEILVLLCVCGIQQIELWLIGINRGMYSCSHTTRSYLFFSELPCSKIYSKGWMLSFNFFYLFCNPGVQFLCQTSLSVMCINISYLVFTIVWLRRANGSLNAQCLKVQTVSPRSISAFTVSSTNHLFFLLKIVYFSFCPPFRK